MPAAKLFIGLVIVSHLRILFCSKQSLISLDKVNVYGAALVQQRQRYRGFVFKFFTFIIEMSCKTFFAKFQQNTIRICNLHKKISLIGRGITNGRN